MTRHSLHDFGLSPLSPLVEDLITIVSHFTGKLYGMRSCKYEGWLRVREVSLKTLKQVRMYPIPINDPRIGELITWCILPNLGSRKHYIV